jgi:hypothetical protein
MILIAWALVQLTVSFKFSISLIVYILEKIAIYNQIIFNGTVDSESTQHGAVEEINVEKKRRATTLASMALDRVAPEDEVSSIKKQRF